MRFSELFEQYGKPVAFSIPKKIAAIKPKPNFRQSGKPVQYRIPNPPAFMSTADISSAPEATAKPKSLPNRALPLRVGKEIIRPNDPRHAAIMGLLARQKTQP